MHLLRSHKIQANADVVRPRPTQRKVPDPAQRCWLADRTKSEGVYTKQIDPEARWQSVAKMEQEFREIANAIRKNEGLGPVLEGLAA